MSKVGDHAPNFHLPASGGGDVSLDDFLGKLNLVLYFYPKDYSTGCTREAVAFRESYITFKNLEAEVLGISPDSITTHERFAKDQRLPFRLLSDRNGSVKKGYGVQSTLGISGRVTFVIDKQGIVRHVYSSQVHPSKHVEEALLALKSLQ